MSQAATLEEMALALARRIIGLVKELLGQRLVSAAVFGSLAASRFTDGSDIDILFVVEGFSDKSMAQRIEAVMPALRRIYNTEEYCAWRKKTGRYMPDLDVIIYTPEEIRRHPPVLLDMVYDVLIIGDNGFLRNELELLRKELIARGARRVRTADGYWYWILSPNIKRGEVIEI
jgi:predicted nucleotidyltransferase